MADRKKRLCRNCKFAREALGLASKPLTCNNVPGKEGRWVIVERFSSCNAFQKRRDNESD